jgi:small subunit ribosomal protein S8
MAVTDSIADMLTIVRNGSRAKMPVVEVRGSNMSAGILTIFKKNDFISNVKLLKDNKQGVLRVYLKYYKDGSPYILGIKRISKPGLRVYKKTDELPKVYGGLGLAVISTSKGLMIDNEAREQKLGGEVICYIW